MPSPKIDIPSDEIAAFCRRWRITEFSLFGSVLREDFGPESDVDCCVVYEPSWRFDLDDLVAMREELSKLFGGRSIDLVERRAITNPFMRYEIITTRKVIYAA